MGRYGVCVAGVGAGSGVWGSGAGRWVWSDEVRRGVRSEGLGDEDAIRLLVGGLIVGCTVVTGSCQVEAGGGGP